MEMKIENVKNLLNILADPKRLAIIYSLEKVQRTASEIEQLIHTSQPTTSFHLKKLIEANIITFKQEGIWKYYQVRDPQIFDLLYSINSYISSSDVWAVEKLQKQSKIVVMGLDGSGKTAIILSLKGDKNLLSYYSLQPTPGSKTIQDIRATFWELGGQVIYREEYLKNPNNYLDGTDKLIYVIDVQNTTRYAETLGYLNQILNTLSIGKLFYNLIIFLHKFDPILANPEEFTDVKIHERLVSKIVAMIPPQLDCQIYKSSIFTVFQKSLIMRIGLFT
ncbi:MAG: arsenical resistance operon repressor, ArsR [Promethearchaeota archaeon CR_4]|nr:MAG: arsenical resistance operon repressor, ArsR [Candidatus Lokiarchaeota archaeon CR_4]